MPNRAKPLAPSRADRSRLAENPEQRARVAADSALALDAFHEALRIDMPTQFMCRKIVKPVEYHGQKMEPGQVLMLLYTAANRDEREFPEPERFDIHRNPSRSLGFSHGHHACIGLHVAPWHQSSSSIGFVYACVCVRAAETTYDETAGRLPSTEENGFPLIKLCFFHPLRDIFGQLGASADGGAGRFLQGPRIRRPGRTRRFVMAKQMPPPHLRHVKTSSGFAKLQSRPPPLMLPLSLPTATGAAGLPPASLEQTT